MSRTLVCDFAGSISDLSGYESPIELVGKPVITAGKYGRGVELSDSNAFRVPWPDGSLYFDPSGGKALALWVNAAAGTAGVTRCLYQAGVWKVLLADSSGNASVTVGSVTLSSGVNVCDGTWHHLLVAYTAADNSLTWYVDGTQAAKGTLLAQGFESGVVSWFGANDQGGEWANATISDLTIWPDPVVAGDVAGIMNNPVVDLRQGAYGFEVHPDGTVLDASQTGNSLALSSGGSFPAGHSSAAALRVSAPVTLPLATADMDRLGLMFWANVDAGVNGELVALLKDDTVRYSVSVNSSSGVATAVAVLDDGTTWTATSGELVGASAWHHLHHGVYTVGNTLFIDGHVAANGGAGGAGTNAIIMSGLNKLRINPGVVLDDLRVVANLVIDESGDSHQQVSERLTTLPVVGPTPTGVSRGDGYPLQAFVKTAGGMAQVNVSLTPPSPADSTPPSVPAIASTSVTGSSATVSWSASTDDVSGVRNYDVAVTLSGVEQTLASTPDTSFTLSGLAADTTYAIRVRARDNAGNVSDWAATSVTTNAATLTPLSAYAFDEGTGITAADAFGGRDINTLNSTDSWTASGKYGSAARGAVDAESFAIPDFAALDTPTRTVSLWAMPADTPGGGYYVKFVDSTGNVTFGVNDINATQVLFRLRINNTNTSLFVTKPADAATAWHHYAMSYDGATLCCYLDGVLATSQAVAGTLNPSTQVEILSHSGNGTDIPDLRMDDLRFYSIAQTAEQIQADMATPVHSGS